MRSGYVSVTKATKPAREVSNPAGDRFPGDMDFQKMALRLDGRTLAPFPPALFPKTAPALRFPVAWPLILRFKPHPNDRKHVLILDALLSVA